MSHLNGGIIIYANDHIALLQTARLRYATLNDLWMISAAIDHI
jgi:hypothetical protein